MSAGTEEHVESTKSVPVSSTVVGAGAATHVKQQCPKCRRWIGVYIARHAGGSVVKLRAHGGRLAGQCDASHRVMPP